MTRPTPQTPQPYPYPQPGPYGGYYTPYGYPQWYPPATQPLTPAERPSRPSRARLANTILAAAIALVTVGALALAALAPSFSGAAASSPSTGLTQVYAAPLTNDNQHWDTSGGCVFDDGGLHATWQTSATLCAFRPDRASDFAASGFYLVAEVGPAVALAHQQKPCVAIQAGEDALTVAFDQTGAYGVHSASAGSGCVISTAGVLLGTDTDAWHTNGITPNRIGVRYDASAGSLAVYVNGQLIATRALQLVDPVTLSLGASGDGEAVFTRFSLYD
ncbi:MAG TPA: hypothetical protein VGR57_18965 [Ktedonobacterales bacterium]|nr:hypothetical protein [Ktedonobacterales bacterium]